MIYIFRVDIGYKTGIGHVKRCIAIAKEIKKRDLDVLFIVKGLNNKVSSLLSPERISYFIMPSEVNYKDEFKYISEFKIENNAHFILDVSYSKTLNDLNNFELYIKELKDDYKYVSLIDGFLNSCVTSFLDLPIDILLIPYVGAEDSILKTKAKRILLGENYFIFDPDDIPNIKSREIHNENANKVLITAGGSDPNGLTIKVIEATNFIEDNHLVLKCVIGPEFDQEYVKEIMSLIRNSKHEIILIKRPKTLSDLMTWSDFTVSASGLTKYLLAATGTPSILISIDKEHADINSSFDHINSSNHLGILNEISTDKIAQEIKNLIIFKSRRAAMSKAGNNAINANGNTKVVDELININMD